ncbi:MAG: Holliday junction resolvase RuvX [Pseudomonadota bacterium]
MIKLFNPSVNCKEQDFWYQQPVSSQYLNEAWKLFPGRWCGIDWGKKNIGIAISDRSRTIANGINILTNTKQTKIFGELKKIIDFNEVQLIVWGLPLNMDGSLGAQAQSCRQIAKNWLQTGHQTPVLLWDERFSSKGVERVLVQQGDLTRKRRKHLTDKLSATWILQTVLDSSLLFDQHLK